jgi:hypothetical protein
MLKADQQLNSQTAKGFTKGTTLLCNKFSLLPHRQVTRQAETLCVNSTAQQIWNRKMPLLAALIPNIMLQQ